ncbi:MAG TPA: BlaI/MecI/CopY family transcriptional regulator [Vicinamibacterales bacterium]|jgi:predicted transcriptional regulator
MSLRRGKTGLASVFGSLELRVLEALWRMGAASVRDMHVDFPGAAYTTLMTTMDRLHRKGILDRERAGRAFVYRPRFSREALETAAAARALGPLLKGESARPILSYLVEAVSREDARLLDDLEALIHAKRRERDGAS